jgi:hypothetical protein
MPHVYGRYINDYDAPYNVEFQKHPQYLSADVVAIRDIEAGQELFASYGIGFTHLLTITYSHISAMLLIL